MNKILTIRENDTVGVGFAVLLTKFSKEHIQRTIAKGLIEAWYYPETTAHEIANNEEWYTHLKVWESAWYADDRFEVSITALSEEPSENEENGGDDKDRNPHYSAFNSIVVKADVDWDLYGEDENVPTRYHEEFSSE